MGWVIKSISLTHVESLGENDRNVNWLLPSLLALSACNKQA
ncbi:MAG: hypothetical protein ACI94Z_002625 [Yoonia sp.]|jgi:hypothetical protein